MTSLRYADVVYPILYLSNQKWMEKTFINNMVRSSRHLFSQMNRYCMHAYSLVVFNWFKVTTKSNITRTLKGL